MLIIDKEINEALKNNYQQAKQSIDIIIFSASRPRKGSSKLFIDTWQALQVAIKRGVKTRVILEQWAGHNPQSIENIRIGQLLKSWGASVKLAKRGVCMHSKTWLFDNKTLIIGSHNSTEAGLCRTKNLSVQVQGHEFCEPYRAYFDNEWQSLAEFI